MRNKISKIAKIFVKIEDPQNQGVIYLHKYFGNFTNFISHAKSIYLKNVGHDRGNTICTCPETGPSPLSEISTSTILWLTMSPQNMIFFFEALVVCSAIHLSCNFTKTSCLIIYTDNSNTFDIFNSLCALPLYNRIRHHFRGKPHRHQKDCWHPRPSSLNEKLCHFS